MPPGGWQTPAPPATPAFAGAQLASWGSRLGAYLIDALILIVPVVILTLIIVGAFAASDASGIVAVVLGVLAYFAVVLVYAPLLMARDGANNGQTWGKQVVDIRVVRDNGEPWNFGQAALREVVLKGIAVSIASSIIPIIPWFLNFFWPLWDDQNRALHDMAVSSHVVRT